MPSVLHFLCGCQLINHLLINHTFLQLSWVLYVDVICLSHDGNVNDATMLAASAALNNS